MKRWKEMKKQKVNNIFFIHFSGMYVRIIIEGPKDYQVLTKVGDDLKFNVEWQEYSK